MHLGCYISALVLISNVALLLFGALSNGGYKDGIGTIVKGPKERIDNWNTALHLLINVLSTGLLTSSNYCMQILCAPSRKEIEEAHAKREWLDVGRLSIRKLFYIEWRRGLVGILLAVSSIPLHLM